MREMVARSLSSLAMLYKHLAEDEEKAEEAHEEALQLFAEVSLITKSYACDNEAASTNVSTSEDKPGLEKESYSTQNGKDDASTKQTEVRYYTL